MKITTFNEYQKEANFLKISLDKFLEKHPDTAPEVKELLALAYDGLGLGEAGEVQGKIKKIIRDDGGRITERGKEAIILEIGDTLWYLASLCQNLGTTLEHAATANIEKLQDRHVKGTVHGSGDYR